jgi:thymidylate kinase
MSHKQTGASMIYAFEGLPAVGKSTTATAIASESDSALIIREVPKLFTRPDPMPREWYMDRHVARWEMALRQKDDIRHVILDGDPFQCLWFNWIYEYEGCWESSAFVREFSRRMISEGRIAFPDLYVYFHVDNDELLRRRHGRDSIEGTEVIERKFKKYLRLKDPVDQYFATLAKAFPERVLLLNSNTVEENVKTIINTPAPSSTGSDMEMLDLLISFMDGYELSTPSPS